jgi:predicted nucleotidyltransferase
MKTISRESTLIALKALKIEAATRYKVKSLELFGSVARDEHVEDSDIDILVDFVKGADLFDLAGLGLFLEEKLGQKVDVVPKQALRPELSHNILAEAVAI